MKLKGIKKAICMVRNMKSIKSEKISKNANFVSLKI